MTAILHLPLIQNRIIHYGQDVGIRIVACVFAWAVGIGEEVVLGMVEHAHESAVARAARYIFFLVFFGSF